MNALTLGDASVELWFTALSNGESARRAGEGEVWLTHGPKET
jgi:hypothetical protein